MQLILLSVCAKETMIRKIYKSGMDAADVRGWSLIKMGGKVLEYLRERWYRRL